MHGGQSEHLPAEVDVLCEDEGAHDGDDDHHEGAEGGGEDRAPALDHQPLHVVGNAGRHYALHHTHTDTCVVSVMTQEDTHHA